MQVGEVLKNQRPWTLPPTATVRAAAQMMREQDIGDVLVVENDDLRGIVTDRDLVIRVVADGRDTDECTLGDVCSGEVVTVGANASTEEAAELMKEHAIRRLPVMSDDGSTVQGVVSLGDLAQETDAEDALTEISKAPPNNEV